MAPIAIATSLTSPPGQPAAKDSAAVNKNQGLTLDADGTATPYSATSTAVSEYDDTSRKAAKATPEAVVDANLPPVAAGPDYYTALLASSAPVPTTKPGATVYGTAIEVLEAYAVQRSSAVWVYDDAVEVGFGARAAEWHVDGASNVFPVQTRDGAGLELAGYTRQAAGAGAVTVFASTLTLPHLLPHLASIQGHVIVHLATTEPSSTLELTDALATPGVLKTLANIPDDWQVVFSSGTDIVSHGAYLYQSAAKTIHVVESTYSGRETASWTFPSSGTFTDVVAAPSAELYVAVASHAAGGLADRAVLRLNTLTPAPESLLSALATAKTVTVTGASRADAEALKAVVLAALYSAPQSSRATLPTIKAEVTPEPSFSPASKVVSFYAAPASPLPQLLAHLFLSSPTVATRLARFGSCSARGVYSVLALSSTPPPALTPTTPSDVIWVSDANVLKATDVLAAAKHGAILVLDLPWTEAELATKLTAHEIGEIKRKGLRVFLLDDASTTPIRQQTAFLLLYTSQPRLSQAVAKVLDAFHGGQVAREDVEAAQASLNEIPQADIDSWTVDAEQLAKAPKSAWVWDALPSQAGLDDPAPTSMVSSWELAARHVLFREAFAVVDAPVEADGPAVTALRPSTADKTYLATVSENRRLTPATYDRNVFHLELDTAGTGLKYEIGEAIGIHGWNDTAEVLDFCSWYGLDPDSVVTFPTPAGHSESRTVFQLLQQNVDLFGRPGKAFYAALAKLATKRADAMTLKFISAPEGAELFQKLAEKETVTFADVLRRYPSARPSIDELVGIVPEIKPRHYSIASSQKAVGDKVELLIVTVDWINSKGSPRFGQCTRYLAALKLGDKVTVSIKPSVMKLPPNDRQPVIMAGLGTGAAPFRAFMQHRAWQRSQGVDVGPLVYYFGSRYRSQEYLYGEEIEAYVASGIISHAGLAFSRDGKDKVYIQHKMKQDKRMLADMLTGKGSDAAYFYLCGPTWPVPDVYEALVGSLTEEAGWARERAEEYIEELKEDERYVLEVY